ncbi:MAG: 1-acylglycerol-3-phosphate O-acyltransferase [Oscillospiraceae bacterium]|nr:1-acylglycerol-3-phosphate O-acyltransferase [Oscillospiraceae bacterium]
MTVLWFLVLGVYGLCATPLVMKARKLEEKGLAEERNEFLKRVAGNVVRRMFRLARVKLTIEGFENIPKEGAVLYTPNHQSIMDVAVMILMREPCGFVIKQEAAKIPIVKTWMNILGCIFVDRDNPRKAAAAISAACDKIKEGKSMVLFPEGTRSKDGQVGEFKGGAFKIAEKTGVTIVPVAIEGTSKMWEEHHRIRKTEICVKILPAIENKGKTRHEIKALAPVVRQQIVDALDSREAEIADVKKGLAK